MTKSLFVAFFKLPEAVIENFCSKPAIGLEELTDKFDSKFKLQAAYCKPKARTEDSLAK